jgi:hypothetical protein
MMFRAARVAVLLILGFLFLNFVFGYALDYPCIFISMLAFWPRGTLLICGIYGRGVGDKSHNERWGTRKNPNKENRKEEYYRKLPQCVTYRQDSYRFIFNPYLF